MGTRWVGAKTSLMNIKPGPFSLYTEDIGCDHDVIACFLVANNCSALVADRTYSGVKEADLALIRVCENAAPAFEDRFPANQRGPSRVKAYGFSLLAPDMGHCFKVFGFKGQVKGFVSEFIYFKGGRRH